jgi:hypothetical protein
MTKIQAKTSYIIICLAMIASCGCASLDKRLASNSEITQKIAVSDFAGMSSSQQDKFIDKCIKAILKNSIPQDDGVRYEYKQALAAERDYDIRALGKVWKLKASYIIDKLSDLDFWDAHMLLTSIFKSPNFIDSLDKQNKKPAEESVKKLVDKLISKDLDYPCNTKKPVLNQLFNFFGKASAISLINNLKTAKRKSDIWINTLNMLGSLDKEVLASLDPKTYDDITPVLIDAVPAEPEGHDALSALEKMFTNDYLLNKYSEQFEGVLKNEGLGYKRSMRIIWALDKAANKTKFKITGKKLATVKQRLKNELIKVITDDIVKINDITMRLKAAEDAIKNQVEQHSNSKGSIQDEMSQFNKYRDEVYVPEINKFTSELKDFSYYYGANELKELAKQYGFSSFLEGMQQ